MGQAILKKQIAELSHGVNLGDHLGSAHLIVDSHGHVLREEMRYPYGLERPFSASASTFDEVDYVYTGKEYDEETGLIYFGGRYYNPDMGRWITPDPLFLEKEPKKIIETPKELNLYAYVQGSPMSAVDSDGEATDFNIGVKPTYDQLPKWGELTREQRIVETVAISVVGTVAAAPMLAVGYVVAAPVVGTAVLSASTKIFTAKTAAYAVAATELGYMANAAKDFVMRNVSLPHLVQAFETGKHFVRGYASPDPLQNPVQGAGAAINYGSMIDERYKFSEQIKETIINKDFEFSGQ